MTNYHVIPSPISALVRGSQSPNTPLMHPISWEVLQESIRVKGSLAEAFQLIPDPNHDVFRPHHHTINQNTKIAHPIDLIALVLLMPFEGA